MEEPFKMILKEAVDEEHEKMLGLDVSSQNSVFPPFQVSGGGIEAPSSGWDLFRLGDSIRLLGIAENRNSGNS
jgi:hypothetical protein